ncbi:MAG: DNA polymerase domain-containing protein [Nitrososphaerota archaeon]|nr:DNA polymerase domain-containing protein [Nitrososphaerota archaeon]
MRRSDPPLTQGSGTVKGWILDLYSQGGGELAVWIKTEGGECIKLVDRWRPSFYVSAPSQKDLTRLLEYLPEHEVPFYYEFAEKFVGLNASERSNVLKIEASDTSSLHSLARHIWRLGNFSKYRLWNLDIPASQLYLYEKGLFPLAYVEADVGEKICWRLLDSAESVEYKLPGLKTLHFKVDVKADGPPSFEDPIGKFQLNFEGEEIIIEDADERENILRLVKAIRELDPDIIVTEGGDSFIFTYLARRALKNDILPNMVLGRDKASISVVRRRGRSYFSYGKVYYRATHQRLLGRLHIDLENSSLYADYGLNGLIEVARTCRIPLHRASRASIGTCMTSAQLYQAFRDDILIPWMKSEAENFKTAMDLLMADRGGFYFEPKLGIHENVGEIDYSSMYPTLMLKHNISPETVGCGCCPDSANRVPELGYNICERRVGIVPRVLELMLRKRIYYKEMRNKADNAEERMRYDQRQSAYKMILCTCFGYLGYRNARFGKVDAHIAACAFARKTLLDTAHLAEDRGFEIVHGIVDSLYLKKEGAVDSDFIDLCREIEKKIGLPISYEGRYRWIVFLPSKTRSGVPVLNRFYGVFADGGIKARGIEVRRRDAPRIAQRFQDDVLRELAMARRSEEFFQRIPNTLRILERYSRQILNGEINLEDLIVTRQLSKDPGEYAANLHHVIAARQLRSRGIDINAGQCVRYIVSDADNRRPERRVRAHQLIDTDAGYDARKYVRILKDTLFNILDPFISKSSPSQDLKRYLQSPS